MLSMARNIKNKEVHIDFSDAYRNSILINWILHEFKRNNSEIRYPNLKLHEEDLYTACRIALFFCVLINLYHLPDMLPRYTVIN